MCQVDNSHRLFIGDAVISVSNLRDCRHDLKLISTSQPKEVAVQPWKYAFESEFKIDF